MVFWCQITTDVQKETGAIVSKLEEENKWRRSDVRILQRSTAESLSLKMTDLLKFHLCGEEGEG